MMRRLDEPELLREPARSVGGAPAAVQAATVLVHVQRVLESELSREQLAALRARLEHAIACGLRGDP